MATIVHRKRDQGFRYDSYSYADDLPPLQPFHSEAYLCGDLPPHYQLPAKWEPAQ